MTKFIYPTLDLFLYDLREGLGQTEEEVTENRLLFKKKLPKINDKQFDERDEQAFEPEFAELFGARRYSDFDSEIYKGYYYPVRLNDTYGLLLDCSLKEEQQDTELQWIDDLRTYIDDKSNGQDATVGQTLMFSAQLPNVSAQEYEFFAKRCYEALMPGADYETNKTGESEFLGGGLFECWKKSTFKSDNMNMESHHVIIAFYPDEKAMEAASSLYPDLMRLLMFRHKMMWTYAQSRALKKRLKAGAVKIEACRKTLDLYSQQQFNVDKLQEILNTAWRILSDYTTALNLLNHQASTMNTNLDNYRKRLAKIEGKVGQNLDLFKRFSDKVQEKYSLQLQTEHIHLTHEVRLLENIIEYIRARVAIEEERRDRSFQETIAIWGIGLAVGAIVASLSGQFPKEQLKEPFIDVINSLFTMPNIWHEPGISIALSIGAALAAGLVTKLVIWLRRLW